MADRERSRALADTDRELLADTLRQLRRTIAEDGGTERVLHGEPHPDNDQY